MDFTTRPANPEELPLILSIFKEEAERMQARGIDQWQVFHNPDADLLAWIQEGFDQGQYHFLEADDTVIGMYRLMEEDLLYWGPQEAKARYLHSLAVRPAWAGKGLGKALVNKLVEQARQDGFEAFRLDCRASNPFLRNYYQSLGFTPVGEAQVRGQTFTLFEHKL